MEPFVTTTNPGLPLVCLGCGGHMTPATGGWSCPACGTTSGPVTR